MRVISRSKPTSAMNCWKIHLNVPRDPNNPTVRELLKICEWQFVHDCKVGHDSDQEGKGMTIYAGSRVAVERVATAIQAAENQGRLPDLGPAKGEVLKDDMPIGSEGTKVWARFSTFGSEKTRLDMHQYGIYGLPFRKIDMMRSPWNKNSVPKHQAHKEAWKASYQILENHWGRAFTGVPEGQTPEWAQWAFDDKCDFPPWVRNAANPERRDNIKRRPPISPPVVRS